MHARMHACTQYTCTLVHTRRPHHQEARHASQAPRPLEAFVHFLHHRQALAGDEADQRLPRTASRMHRHTHMVAQLLKATARLTSASHALCWRTPRAYNHTRSYTAAHRLFLVKVRPPSASHPLPGANTRRARLARAAAAARQQQQQQQGLRAWARATRKRAANNKACPPTHHKIHACHEGRRRHMCRHGYAGFGRPSSKLCRASLESLFEPL